MPQRNRPRTTHRAAGEVLRSSNGNVTFRYRQTSETQERRMLLPAFKCLRRFLQHVLPRGFHKVRHYGILSRCSKTDLDVVRAAMLEALQDVEPDFELAAWSIPTLRRQPDAGPRCPVCDQPLQFESFTRIRPPPLECRGGSQDQRTTRFESVEN